MPCTLACSMGQMMDKKTADSRLRCESPAAGTLAFMRVRWPARVIFCGMGSTGSLRTRWHKV